MLTLADIKPSIISVATFFAIWLLVANLSYMLFVVKFQVPGLTDLVKRATGAA
jgi:hypothetical protein